ncbi:hypothetical protein [Polaribacter glomeratus]|uniref:Uncharacterized protein n=1 Tax=Polaribacter glomeratus TaxID=102 RepID=A0A2S7WFW2_9FLAO|nr:hypothetical protein [Polaribacter glomeratus]PQJ76494.1 hypothetical protein BTO16_11350 [Polaribacter glomeratus]
MKNSFQLITLVLGIWGCNNLPTQSISLTVLSDRTDLTIPKPSISQIKYFFDDELYQNGKRIFRFQTITNTSINKSFGASIAVADPFGNSLQRKADIQKFYLRIDTLFALKNKEKNTYRSSSILNPLLKQLKEIQTSKTTRKVVLLYSDILEASDVFNVYKTHNQRLLIKEPNKVVQYIQSQITIPKLEGVELYIIYYPTDRINNRLFEKMTIVYQELFKDSGLKLQIGIENRITL